MKRVLMLCYFFPPLGSSGTQRSSKFVKYLPGHNWHASVIGGVNPDWPRDESQLSDLPPDTEVIRFPIPQTPWKRMRRFLNAIRMGRLANRLAQRLDFPDNEKPWSEKALREAIRLHTEKPFDVLYTSSPPYSICTAACAMRDRLSLPWVLDLRDPWSFEEDALGDLPASVRKRHRAAERAAVHAADAVICAHPEVEQFLVETLGLSKEKVHLITNGFDPADYPAAAPTPAPTARIVHTGSFARIYCPDRLQAALDAHWDGPPDGVPSVELHFIGGTGPTQFREDYPGLIIHATPRVPHDEAVQAQQSADLVLVTLDRRMFRGVIAGKIFEYLACGRPILAIVPEDGAMAEIVRDCKAGWVADCDQSDEIVRVMKEALQTVRAEGYVFEPDHEKIARYDRRTLTAQLAGVLEQLA